MLLPTNLALNTGCIAGNLDRFRKDSVDIIFSGSKELEDFFITQHVNSLPINIINFMSPKGIVQNSVCPIYIPGNSSTSGYKSIKYIPA